MNQTTDKMTTSCKVCKEKFKETKEEEGVFRGDITSHHIKTNICEECCEYWYEEEHVRLTGEKKEVKGEMCFFGRLPFQTVSSPYLFRVRNDMYEIVYEDE